MTFSFFFENLILNELVNIEWVLDKLEPSIGPLL